MISKLREIDEDVVAAEGPRFDLDEVLDAALGILRTLSGRAEMRYPGHPPPLFGHFRDAELRPFDEAGYAEIADEFREAKRTAFDVTDFDCVVEFGPFAADMYLLGFEALHGPLNNCVTTFDMSWEHLDPTPVILLMMRHGMIDRLGTAQQAFLENALKTHLWRDIEWELWDVRQDGDGIEARAFVIRFPHDAFGAGRGPIRICRYLHRSLRDGGRGP